MKVAELSGRTESSSYVRGETWYHNESLCMQGTRQSNMQQSLLISAYGDRMTNGDLNEGDNESSDYSINIQLYEMKDVYFFFNVGYFCLQLCNT